MALIASPDPVEPAPPTWVFFDLNGTLLDPAGIAEPLGGGEAERRLVREAFGAALLQAMADTLSGGYRPLPEHLEAALRRQLVMSGYGSGRLEAALERAGSMDPFPGAAEAVERLRDAGIRVAVLSNSPVAAAEANLRHAGLLDRIPTVIGSDQVEVYKPHPAIYRYAAAEVRAAPPDIWMAAAHGWDLQGARRVGFRTAWVTHGAPLPSTLPAADVQAEDLRALAEAIVLRCQPAPATFSA